MNKMKNSKSEDEFRIIFDYSRIIENLSEIYVELSSKVHDNLSYSEHKNLMIVDLKYAYSIVLIHSEDREIFAFNISEIEQIQSCRMQQGSQLIEFTMIEKVYRACDAISSSHKKSFLLHSKKSEVSSFLIFYMNDFFDGFSSFEEQYYFLRQHFLSRMK